MSPPNNIKVATTYFPTQPDDICMNKVGTEPTPLRIIKFQNYLQQNFINIQTEREALDLLGRVLNDADYGSVNKD